MSDTPRTDTNLRGSDTRPSSPFAEFTRQIERELAAERKRAELAELTVSQKREQIASCEAALDEANKRADEAISAGRQVADYNMELLTLLADANRRADEAEAKLYKIARTPVMPFPDPGAHSERAFSDAVYRAWSDIQRIARNREAMKNG